MQIIATDFPGLLILEPIVHRDERGFFLESFRENFFLKQGLNFSCVQANQAMSVQKGVMRGLHFQIPPQTQAKLVWVTAGEVLDVVVDLRELSPTYGKHYSVHLSGTNFRRFFIPKGFAHGYITLTPNSEFNYMVDEYYAPKHEGGILWNDPDLGINWPLNLAGEELPIISDKDKKLPRLKNFDNPFKGLC